jgi:hypothetical protein
MFVTVVRVILDSYFLRFGDQNPGIRIFPLPLPFFPLLPFFPPPLLPSPPFSRLVCVNHSFLILDWSIYIYSRR